MINTKFSPNYSIYVFVIGFILLNVFVTGCYTIRVFHNTDMLRNKHDGEMHSISIPFTERQIVGQAKVRSACPSGASLVQIEQTVSDGLFHYLSIGFYSPHTIKIWCKRRVR